MRREEGISELKVRLEQVIGEPSPIALVDRKLAVAIQANLLFWPVWETLSLTFKLETSPYVLQTLCLTVLDIIPSAFLITRSRA